MIMISVKILLHVRVVTCLVREQDIPNIFLAFYPLLNPIVVGQHKGFQIWKDALVINKRGIFVTEVL